MGVGGSPFARRFQLARSSSWCNAAQPCAIRSWGVGQVAGEQIQRLDRDLRLEIAVSHVEVGRRVIARVLSDDDPEKPADLRHGRPRGREAETGPRVAPRSPVGRGRLDRGRFHRTTPGRPNHRPGRFGRIGGHPRRGKRPCLPDGPDLRRLRHRRRSASRRGTVLSLRRQLPASWKHCTAEQARAKNSRGELRGNPNCSAKRPCGMFRHVQRQPPTTDKFDRVVRAFGIARVRGRPLDKPISPAGRFPHFLCKSHCAVGRPPKVAPQPVVPGR